MSDKFEVNKTIYEQDCEFYRYQDRLKWSRFQTVAIIEGAVLYGIYKISVDCWDQRIFMIFGFLLILIVSLITLKDDSDASSHMDRIKKFENLFNPFVPRKWPCFLSGKVTIWVGIIVINVFNMIVLFRKW